MTGINCEIEEIANECSFKLFVTAKLNGQTGVEMEALTGVSVGLVQFMIWLKAIDKSMVISDIQLEEKSGGKSGDFRKTDDLSDKKLELNYPCSWEYKLVVLEDLQY